MKGCLAVVGVLALLVVVLIAGCTGFVLYKSHQVGEQQQEAQVRLAATNDRYRFAPPADALLDEGRLDSWLDIRAETSRPLGEMLMRAHELQTTDRDVGFFEGLSTAFGTFKGLAQAVLQAPTTLADQLERNTMSIAEYDWINGIVHATIRRAAADGEEAAVALRDAIDASLAKIDDEMQGKELDPARLDDLERERITEWKPENLALLTAREQRIVGSPAALLLDIFVVQLAAEVSGKAAAGDGAAEEGTAGDEGR